MTSTNDLADAVLDEVLEEEAPADLTEVVHHDSQGGVEAAGEHSTTELESVTETVGGEVVDDSDDSRWEHLPPTVSADEAQQMMDRWRASLAEFDSTTTLIMQTRAWKALGYESPKACVLVELGPDKMETDDPNRVSRSHAYRLARVATLIYELAERLGEDAYTVELTERAIRSIPARYDEQIVDRLEAAFEESNPGDEPNEVVDGVIEDARRELQETGALSAPGDEPNAGNDEDPADTDLASLGVGDLSFTQDDHPDPGAADSDDEMSQPDDDGPEAWEGDQGSTSRDSVREAFAVESADDDALTSAVELRELLAGFKEMPRFEPILPGVLDGATDEELADLVEHATAAAAIVTSVREAADARL